MGTLVDLARMPSEIIRSKEEPVSTATPATEQPKPANALPKDLERRIEFVGQFHAFTRQELSEAKEIAAGDIENAIPCFRRLLADILG